MFVPCSSAVMLELNLVLHLLKRHPLLKEKTGSFGGVFLVCLTVSFPKHSIVVVEDSLTLTQPLTS